MLGLSTTAGDDTISATDRLTLQARLPLPGIVSDMLLSPDGQTAYAATGSSGVQIVDISNPNAPVVRYGMRLPGAAVDLDRADNRLYAAATGQQGGLHTVVLRDAAAPYLESTLPISGSLRGVQVVGERAYLAAGFAGGLQVVDITTMPLPTLVARVDTDGSAEDITVVGQVAFLADGREGVRSYDISDPNNPRELDRLELSGTATAVRVAGERAYVALGGQGFAFVDISNPDDMELLAYQRLEGSVSEVVATDAQLLVAARSGGLYSLDAGDLRERGRFETLAQTRDAQLVNDVLYVAAGRQGLALLDARGSKLSLLGRLPLGGIAAAVRVVDDLAFVATGSGGLQIVDVSNPISPTLVSSVVLDGAVTQVEVTDTAAFLAAGNQGVQVVDITEVVTRTNEVTTTNPVTPTLIAGYDTPDTALDVHLAGDQMYVADVSSVLAFERRDTFSLTLLHDYNLPSLTYAQQVHRGDNWLLIANGGLNSGLLLLEPGESISPTVLSRLDLALYGSPYTFQVTGDQVYVATGIGGVQAIDVSQPRAPAIRGSYNTPGVAHAVAISGERLYVADDDGGVQVLQLAPLEPQGWLPRVQR
ncbi:MAG: hypothetical protein HC914_16465 [Chloroflexaceae bacterium]|nr:hypothetical protein [Chloroflexaceae bacterium]